MLCGTFHNDDDSGGSGKQAQVALLHKRIVKADKCTGLCVQFRLGSTKLSCHTNSKWKSSTGMHLACGSSWKRQCNCYSQGMTTTTTTYY